MANRFSQTSTSSFKPLSLDEIMAVPLAKQKQHDEASLALDEFYNMEANSLDVDKDYVSGQIDAFRKESDQLSDQLLNEGVDRNLINKVKSLRNRKNQEFSLEGGVGKASAAFNEFKANEKAIMARKDLTAAQKQAGLEQAKNNYQGVLEGDQYQNYIGTAYVDIMEKGRDIASKMKPQEIAGMLGLEYDPRTQSYSDGTYQYETLTPRQIARVVKQGLSGDVSVMDFANEMQKLGLGDANSMIEEAALSAANVFQVDNVKEERKQLPSYINKSVNATGDVGWIDTSQPWDSQDMHTLHGAFSQKYDIDDSFGEDIGFVDGNINLIPFDLIGHQERVENYKRVTSPEFLQEMRKAGANQQDIQSHLMVAERRYGTTEEDKAIARGAELKEQLDGIRNDNPVLNGSSDEEIYNLWNKAKEDALVSVSQLYKPINPSNTFWSVGEDLLGTGDTSGTFMSKQGIIAGGTKGAYDELASQLDMDLPEFNEAVRKGKFLGFSPGLIEIPNALVVQIELPKGEKEIIFFEPDNNMKNEGQAVGKMNTAIIEGIPYDEPYLDAKGQTNHIITELNPLSKKYEAAIIRGPGVIPPDEIRKIKWTSKYSQKAGLYYQQGDYNGNEYIKMSQDQERQRVTNSISDMYDAAPDAKRGLTKEQKS